MKNKKAILGFILRTATTIAIITGICYLIWRYVDLKCAIGCVKWGFSQSVMK